MTNTKKISLTEKQRTDLRTLAENVDTAYDEFRKAVAAIGPDEDWDGSCRACHGAEVCSSFLGDRSSLSARCQRDFCGHSLLVHVG